MQPRAHRDCALLVTEGGADTAAARLVALIEERPALLLVA
jgi:hypothetical protein